MNCRSKTTAMVLCFLFGCTGAHWFYLGRSQWGLWYVITLAGAWPMALSVALFFGALSPDLGGTLGAIAFVLAWLGEGLLTLMALYDFCCLLSIDPRRFDQLYN